MNIAKQTKNVTKIYGSIEVVHDASLKINKGEVFSILGVNGAGKSTLIKMLTCILKITSGKAFDFVKDVMKEAD